MVDYCDIKQELYRPLLLQCIYIIHVHVHVLVSFLMYLEDVKTIISSDNYKVCNLIVSRVTVYMYIMIVEFLFHLLCSSGMCPFSVVITNGVKILNHMCQTFYLLSPLSSCSHMNCKQFTCSSHLLAVSTSLVILMYTCNTTGKCTCTCSNNN